MTTTTRNEAAERQEPIACQRCGQGVLPEDQPAHDEWDAVLAAERATGYAEGSRATVERIRAQAGATGFITIHHLHELLDEEAAR